MPTGHQLKLVTAGCMEVQKGPKQVEVLAWSMTIDCARSQRAPGGLQQQASKSARKPWP